MNGDSPKRETPLSEDTRICPICTVDTLQPGEGECVRCREGLPQEELVLSEPPFDGKPCPCCPVEIRNLHAVASNFVRGSRDTTIDDLRRAVDLVQPLMDKHFSDTLHALGSVR